jgi:hypothetical protein
MRKVLQINSTGVVFRGCDAKEFTGAIYACAVKGKKRPVKVTVKKKRKVLTMPETKVAV